MTGFPLRYVHQNILVGQGDARAALFRVDTVSYPFLAAADKREWLRRLARFAFAAEADFSLWRVCRAYPADELRGAGAGAARRAPPVGDRVAGVPEAGTRRTCASCARSCRRSISRSRWRPIASRAWCAGWIGCAGAWRALFGVGRRGADPGVGDRGADRRRGARVPPRRGVPAAAARDDEASCSGCCAARRAAGSLSPRWTITGSRRALVVETANGQPAYEPLGADLVRHVNAPILEHERSLVVDAEEGRSHQALLAMGALPEESEFPGGAELLFSPLEALAFPVDAVAHARWLGNREAITRVRRRIIDADVAFSEQMASSHGPLSYSAEENRQLARELDAYLQSHERPPLLNTAISLAVGADSREELEHRVEALRAPVRDDHAAPPARAAARAVPRSLAARRRRHGARLRGRADDRAVRRVDADRHASGRLRARRLHRPDVDGRRAAGALRHHRGVADGAAAVDPARRHARVGEDDRRRAARLPGRAPRLA